MPKVDNDCTDGGYDDEIDFYGENCYSSKATILEKADNDCLTGGIMDEIDFYAIHCSPKKAIDAKINFEEHIVCSNEVKGALTGKSNENNGTKKTTTVQRYYDELIVSPCSDGVKSMPTILEKVDNDCLTGGIKDKIDICGDTNKISVQSCGKPQFKCSSVKFI